VHCHAWKSHTSHTLVGAKRGKGSQKGALTGGLGPKEDIVHERESSRADERTQSRTCHKVVEVKHPKSIVDYTMKQKGKGYVSTWKKGHKKSLIASQEPYWGLLLYIGGHPQRVKTAGDLMKEGIHGGKERKVKAQGPIVGCKWKWWKGRIQNAPRGVKKKKNF